MTANPMQRKVRNSFLLGVLIMLVIAIAAGTAIYFLVIQPKLEEEKEEDNKPVAKVYRLKAGMDVVSGEEITADMLEITEIPVSTTATDFVTSPIFGYKSKIALTGGTVLTYSMLYEEELDDTLRYVEYNMITMPVTVNVGDYIDIRLRLSNGQDLIVISKADIKNIIGQTVGLTLTEEEILILNSAIVESYIMTGSELYMASYVEPGMQTAAVNTYVPTDEVINLINVNENIVTIAKEKLASQYMSIGSEVRGKINNTKSQYAEDAKSNVENGMQQQIQAARAARESYLSELEEY